MVYSQGMDEEQEYRARSRWNRFIAATRQTIDAGAIAKGDRAGLQAIVNDLISVAGRDAIVAMSADYAHGNRLEELIKATVERLHELLVGEESIGVALSSFSADRAVRRRAICFFRRRLTH
ncbi:hypothetical protein LJR234_002161 [Mesorhizobium amorphae]|uniref:hypothetical protein n=1 Tax=Mesorhizobium amorphae TaxID=71433 RepID=UPI003ED0C09F